MRYRELIEATTTNYEFIKYLVGYLVSIMPNSIPENDSIDIPISRSSFDVYFNKNNVDMTLRQKALNILSSLSDVRIINKESTISDITMGFLLGTGNRKVFSLGINVSGLMGNSNTKSRNDILTFKGSNSTDNFKSVLGHELRHLVQNHEYGDKLQNPEDDNYSYDTDPAEIDAAFMESLLDYDVEDYNDIHEYVNDVMTAFGKKKPLSKKTYNHYYRKSANFYTMSKSGETNDDDILDRLNKTKESFNNDFFHDFDKAVSIINSEWQKNVKKDFEDMGYKMLDDRQDYHINIPKADAIRNILHKLLNGAGKDIGSKNTHLIVATICYANTFKSIRNYKKVIDKLYKSTSENLSISDTIESVIKNGYFNKESKYITPIIDSLKKEL